MQRKTVDYVQTRHSPDERTSSRESHLKDEVDGPLSSKARHDETQVNHGKTLKKKTVHEETTEVLLEEANPTASEDNVSVFCCSCELLAEMGFAGQSGQRRFRKKLNEVPTSFKRYNVEHEPTVRL